MCLSTRVQVSSNLIYIYIYTDASTQSCLRLALTVGHYVGDHNSSLSHPERVIKIIQQEVVLQEVSPPRRKGKRL